MGTGAAHPACSKHSVNGCPGRCVLARVHATCTYLAASKNQDSSFCLVSPGGPLGQNTPWVLLSAVRHMHWLYVCVHMSERGFV